MAKGNSKWLKGKPVVIDKLDAELGGKLVDAVMDDMKRAAKERSEKRSKADRAAPKRGTDDQNERR